MCEIMYNCDKINKPQKKNYLMVEVKDCANVIHWRSLCLTVNNKTH